MSFDRGSFNFTIFELRQDLPENALDLFAAVKAGPLDAVTGEIQYGWVTGHHLLDTSINAESAMIGGCYYLSLRSAVRKMPSSLLNAICKREEKAYIKANNLEYASGKMKRQIREAALEKHLPSMPPAISGIPVVIDPREKLLYLGATSNSQIDLFIENFFEVLKVEPLQWNPGLILENKFQSTEATFPILTVAGSPATEPTIGRDFLMWLWYFTENGGKVTDGQYGEFDLLVEGPLTFADSGEEARGSSEITVKKGENPMRSAEAKAAIQVGKKLKKARISLTRADQVWSGTFDADLFAFGSFKLPEGDQMNDDGIFEERMLNLSIFKVAMELYFAEFAKTMTGMDFPKTEKAIREWAQSREGI